MIVQPAPEIDCAPPATTRETGETPRTVLEVKNLTIRSKRPGVRPLIENLDLKLADGQVAFLVGRSGVGKSLLFHAVLGLLPRRDWEGEGTIRIDDVTTWENGVPDERKLADLFQRNHVSAVFQSPSTSLHPSFSIGRQLFEALQRGGRDWWRYWGYEERLVDERLACVGLEHDFACRRRNELSGGQQQRAMISFALGSAILLADEPTSALDDKAEADIIHLLADLRARTQGIRSMLIITHNPAAFVAHLYNDTADSQLRKQGDQIWTLQKGDGSGPSILAKPYPVSKHKEQNHPIERPACQDEWLLEALDVSIDISQGWMRSPKRVFENLTFGIRRGGLSFIAGPSGCGKTTLARAILGLQPCSAGRIVLNSRRGANPPALPNKIELSSKEGRHKARPLVQIVFQDAASTFNPRMTVGETFQEIIKLKEDKDRGSDEVHSLINKVGFSTPEDVLAQLPSEFSEGQCQRLGIARALLLGPELVVADEPFANQDEETAWALADLFVQLAKETEITFLVISHDRRLLDKVCHGGIEFVYEDSLQEGAPQ